MLMKSMPVTYKGFSPNSSIESSVQPQDDFDIGQILVVRVDGGTVYFQFVDSAEGPDSVEMQTPQNTFLDCAQPLREYNRKFLQGLIDPDSSEEK